MIYWQQLFIRGSGFLAHAQASRGHPDFNFEWIYFLASLGRIPYFSRKTSEKYDGEENPTSYATSDTLRSEFCNNSFACWRRIERIYIEGEQPVKAFTFLIIWLLLMPIFLGIALSNRGSRMESLYSLFVVCYFLFIGFQTTVSCSQKARF